MRSRSPTNWSRTSRSVSASLPAERPGRRGGTALSARSRTRLWRTPTQSLLVVGALRLCVCVCVCVCGVGLGPGAGRGSPSEASCTWCGKVRWCQELSCPESSGGAPTEATKKAAAFVVQKFDLLNQSCGCAFPSCGCVNVADVCKCDTDLTAKHRLLENFIVFFPLQGILQMTRMRRLILSRPCSSAEL